MNKLTFVHSFCKLAARYFVKSKSNILLFSLYYVEACKDFAGSNSASLSPCNAAPYKEMPHRWRAVLGSIWPSGDFNLRPSTQETKVLPLDQLAGHKYCLSLRLLVDRSNLSIYYWCSQDPNGRDQDQDRDLEKIWVQDQRPRLEKIFKTQIKTRWVCSRPRRDFETRDFISEFILFINPRFYLLSSSFWVCNPNCIILEKIFLTEWDWKQSLWGLSCPD